MPAGAAANGRLPRAHRASCQSETSLSRNASPCISSIVGPRTDCNRSLTPSRSKGALPHLGWACEKNRRRSKTLFGQVRPAVCCEAQAHAHDPVAPSPPKLTMKADVKADVADRRPNQRARTANWDWSEPH